MKENAASVYAQVELWRMTSKSRRSLARTVVLLTIADTAGYCAVRWTV